MLYHQLFPLQSRGFIFLTDIKNADWRAGYLYRLQGEMDLDNQGSFTGKKTQTKPQSSPPLSIIVSARLLPIL